MNLGFNKKILDYKVCYELRTKQRLSVYKIPQILREQGIFNQRTGKNLTSQAVWKASWLYALEHPDEAKSDTVSLFRQYGMVFDDKAEIQFGKDMISKARLFLSRKKYKQFLLDFPEYKKYE